MAVEINSDPTFPESTGAVATPSEPVVTEQVPGHPESTGAVESDGKPVTTLFGELGQKPTGAVETPGPFTMVAPQVKVVRSGRRAAQDASGPAETKTTDQFDGR